MIVAYGCWLRVAFATHAPLWNDEVQTSFFVSGHSVADAATISELGPHITGSLLQRRFLVPSPTRSIADDVHSFVANDPPAPPLYYLLVRLAAELWPDPVTPARAVSVLFSLLFLPSFFWLVRELFHSKWAPWIGVCLAAVSPQRLLSAYESRCYSMWALSICLATAALVHAIKSPHRRWWVLYALTLTLMLHSHPLSLGVLAAHGVVMLVTAVKARSFRLVLPFAAAATVGVLLMTPWLWAVYQHRMYSAFSTHWLSKPVHLIQIFHCWAFEVGAHVFITDSSWWAFGVGQLISLLVPALVFLTAALLWRRGERFAFLVIVPLLVAIPSLLGLQDLLLGGGRIAVARYEQPTMVASLLCLTWLFDRLPAWLATRNQARPSSVEPGSRSEWPRRLVVFAGHAALFVLLGVGALDCYRVAHNPARFKHQPRFDAAVAALEGVPQPLLVFPAPGVTPLLLSLPFPDAEFMVMTSIDDLQRTAAAPNVFVVGKLNAFEPFAKKLGPLLDSITAAGYVLEPVGAGELWRIQSHHERKTNQRDLRAQD